MGKLVSEEFEIRNGLKQGDALSPLLFNLVLEYIVRMAGDNSGGVELNGNIKVLRYSDKSKHH